jgi:hypothetical protein
MPEVVLPVRARPEKAAGDEELRRRAAGIAREQGTGKSAAGKRGPESGVTCQRCEAGCLECVKTGGPRQKACDACVKAKHACLAPGEAKPERKRVKTERPEKAEEQEASPRTDLAEFLDGVVKEVRGLKKEVAGVRAGVERMAQAIEWIADHFEDEEEEARSGEEEEVAAEVKELRAEVAEAAGESMTLE